MKKRNSMLLPVLMIGLMVMGLSGVMAYDASTPYTVTMNFIVGSDSSFTVALAGAETTIDFNPATINSKSVEPDSQVAGSSTPILTITNTGNVALNFTHKVTTAMPAFAVVSYDIDNTVDWSKTITNSYSTINTSIASGGTVKTYMWANFTSADAGTTARTYQINSTVA